MKILLILACIMTVGCGITEPMVGKPHKPDFNINDCTENMSTYYECLSYINGGSDGGDSGAGE